MNALTKYASHSVEGLAWVDAFSLKPSLLGADFGAKSVWSTLLAALISCHAVTLSKSGYLEAVAGVWLHASCIFMLDHYLATPVRELRMSKQSAEAAVAGAGRIREFAR